MHLTDKVIVVTGGGNGIGRALTLQLVREGARVAAVDINGETLHETQALAGPHADRISLHVLDVSERPAVEALPEQVLAAHGAVDGLINNAGIAQPLVRIADLPYETIERVLSVNLYGPLYMVKAFLPHLRQRPVAHIVGVSSMGGLLPVPSQTIYGTSKAALKLLTEGLYVELLETNVRVTLVLPGMVDTKMGENSGIVPEGGPDEPPPGFGMTTPEAAAEAIVEGIKRDKLYVYVGRDARVMNLLYRLAPRRAIHLVYNQMKSLLSANTENS